MKCLLNVYFRIPVRTQPWRVSNMHETEGVKLMPRDVPEDSGFLRYSCRSQ
jgi:hypothetical protein